MHATIPSMETPPTSVGRMWSVVTIYYVFFHLTQANETYIYHLERMATGPECFTNNHCREEDNDDLPQEQAQNQPRRDTARPHRSGYDCEFVEKPPDTFPQTHCPICLLVLHEPQQLNCCGNSFCEACIKRVRRKRGACPSCNEANFISFPDKRLKRSLYDFRIYCCHQGDGCVWKGPLRELDSHLNLRPSPQGRLDGCPFTEVECVHCRNVFQRRRCKDHESDSCLKRPYTCQHCRYSATFEDVTENHLPTCPLLPVACPNCQLVLEYQEMEHHVDQDCPLTPISCDFHTVGCPAQIARKDMPSHVRCDLDQHRVLLKEHMATHPGEDRSTYVPLLVKLVDMYKELEGKKGQVNQRNQNIFLVFLLALLVLSLFLAGIAGQALMLAIGTQLATDILANITRYFHTVSKSNTVQFTMPDFEKHRRAGDKWFSPSFYTHNRGYRMCLGVRANGCGPGLGTHVSVLAYLMPGAFDDELQWPFRGKVTVTLCNQVSGKSSDYTHTIDYAQVSDPAIIQRVTTGGKAAKGCGVYSFIAHSELRCNTNSQSQYLKNGSLIFRVKVTT